MPRTTGTGKRKKTTTVVEEIPDNPTGNDGNEPTDFDVVLESVGDTEKLSEVLEQFGETGVLLKVLRKTPTGDEFCYQTSTVPIDESFIQSNYGGGDYVARVFINGKYKIPVPLKIAAPRVTTSATPSNPNTDPHSRFLETIVLEMVKNMGNNAGPSFSELTQALTNIDNLRGKQESALDMLMKGIALAKEMNGGGGDPGDWKTELVRMGKDALPAITSYMNRGSNGTPSVTVPNPPPGPGGPTDKPPAAIADAQLKMGITYLKKKCLNGIDAGLIIEWVQNNAEEYQPLIDSVFVNEFSKFIELDPDVGREPFLQWFQQLFNGLRSAFKPADTVDDDPGRDTGNDSDIGNNGKPSTGTGGKKKS